MQTVAVGVVFASCWIVLASGLFREFLFEVGFLVECVPFRELKERVHVNARAQSAGAADDFSAQIRAGMSDPKR
jgi:hypothetical protein